MRNKIEFPGIKYQEGTDSTQPITTQEQKVVFVDTGAPKVDGLDTVISAGKTPEYLYTTDIPLEAAGFDAQAHYAAEQARQQRATQQQAAGGNGGNTIPPYNGGRNQFSKPESKKPFWKIFFTAAAGAMAGCLVFVSLFQGGAWIGDALRKPNDVASSSSRLPNKMSVNNFADVVEAVSPGVVTVLVNKQTRDYFGQVRNQEGLGSGVVYHVEGNKVFIITNAHVVEGASEIAVYHNELSRNELDIATVVDYDVDADIAVLMLENPRQSYNVIVDFANSDELKIGEEVFAVGSPMGEEYRGSVTRGIISGLNRQVPIDKWGQKYQTFIQTDAAINGGNSGGGLIDINGQLVGINSAKLNEADNMGLAIPTNTVLAVLATMDVPQPEVDWEFTNVDTVPVV